MFYKYKRIIIAGVVIIISIISFGFISFVNNSKLISGNSNNDATCSKQSSKINSNIKGSQNAQESLTNSNQNNQKVVDTNSDSSSINSNDKANLTSSNEQNNIKNQTINVADGGSFNVNYKDSNMVNYNTKNIIKNNDSNVNYNENLELKSIEKNQENKLVFKINDARLSSKNQLNFNLEVIKNDNFKGLNVVVTDNFGNSLEVTPTVSSKGNNINYKVILVNPNTKSIHIEIQNEFNTSEQQGCQISLNSI